MHSLITYGRCLDSSHIFFKKKSRVLRFNLVHVLTLYSVYLGFL